MSPLEMIAVGIIVSVFSVYIFEQVALGMWGEDKVYSNPLFIAYVVAVPLSLVVILFSRIG